tara:strand:- start:547 stop:813 length:267 start_codon:yes stop_codon:yes gene_type:complete
LANVTIVSPKTKPKDSETLLFRACISPTRANDNSFFMTESSGKGNGQPVVEKKHFLEVLLLKEKSCGYNGFFPAGLWGLGWLERNELR